MTRAQETPVLPRRLAELELPKIAAEQEGHASSINKEGPQPEAPSF